MNENIAIIDNVSKNFVLKSGPFHKQYIRAVQHVTIRLQRGRILALVGESGSGKSTLARMLTRIESPSTGNIFIDKDGCTVDINAIPPRDYYKRVQMVFQDPYSAVNPRKRIWQVVTSAPANLGKFSCRELHAIAARQLDAVGLGDEYFYAFPDTLSGGQRQRLCIARALAAEPEILVLDEPLSALDMSIQGQILNLLMNLQQRLQLTYLFVSHDLSVVRHIADDVAVMHQGQLVEHGTANEVFASPRHPYTQSLLETTSFPKGRINPAREANSSRAIFLESPLTSLIPSPREQACDLTP